MREHSGGSRGAPAKRERPPCSSACGQGRERNLSCGTKPDLKFAYYPDANCTDLRRMPFGAFQKFAFAIETAQLGFDGVQISCGRRLVDEKMPLDNPELIAKYIALSKEHRIPIDGPSRMPARASANGPANARLDVLTSGVVPLNPAEFSDSQAAENILNQLKKEYEFAAKEPSNLRYGYVRAG